MSGDSSQFEDLSTHRLESILRKSLTDGSLTPEDLLAISGILERRDAGKGKGPPDVEAAWDRFLEKQRGLPPGSPPEGKSHLKPIRKEVLQRCAVLAVCVLTLASAFLTTQAFGYDPVGAIIHWTADVFHFETDGSDWGEFEGTHLLDDFPEDGEMPADFIPSWMPDGFEKTASKRLSLAGVDSIIEEYSDGKNYITFDLSKYDSPNDLRSELFEKQQTDTESRICDGKKYILTENGAFGFWTAAWSDGPWVFHISGELSKENLIKIIDSLGG